MGFVERSSLVVSDVPADTVVSVTSFQNLLKGRLDGIPVLIKYWYRGYYSSMGTCALPAHSTRISICWFNDGCK